jgi:alpha-1,2-mannosyltransferase
MRIAALRVGAIALFGALPLFAVLFVVVDLASGSAGWAFREAFLGASEAVVRGESPYPALDDPSVERGTAYVYPPVLALVVTPFTVLTDGVAVVLFALLLVAAVPATLAVLGVRDWRCYGLALLWPPVLSAVHVENITLLVGLAAALVWRFRDRPVLGGLALGVSAAVKPLLWPLGLWLIVTRRFRAAIWSVGAGLGLALASWAAIGFAGVVDYQQLLRRLSEVMDEWGYSVYALALDANAGEPVARTIWAGVGLAVLAAAVVVSRRGDERTVFALAVAATIAASPIVWLHYFALLLVVVAVAQPRLGAAWFAPLAMYGAEEITNGSTFQTSLTLLAAALTVVLALRSAPVARPARSLVGDRARVAERTT